MPDHDVTIRRQNGIGGLFLAAPYGSLRTLQGEGHLTFTVALPPLMEHGFIT